MNNRLTLIVVLAWGTVAVSFLVFSLIVGGAAINGKVVGGHYYLGSHGNYPEVSRGVYLLSALLSAAFGLAFSAFAGVITWHKSRKPTFHPVAWIGPAFAAVAGLAFVYLSIRSILNALTVA
ncbi:MAG TPA: hypothetical protein VN281_15185 [Verrucomicrobiae bacterium]|nr:hypothetical protein [Verrucomicrobiae bacterium]